MNRFPSCPEIAVLDDDATVRSCMVELLADGGFPCIGLGDPDAALTLFDRAWPALLLTDIDLGVRGLDGFEVARRLRARRPTLPVLFTSGRTWLLNEHRCQSHDRVLPKPFRGTALLDLVRELLPSQVPARMVAVPA